MPNIKAALVGPKPVTGAPNKFDAALAFDNEVVVTGLSDQNLAEMPKSTIVLVYGNARRTVYPQSAEAFRMVGATIWTVAITLNEKVFKVEDPTPNGQSFASLMAKNGDNVLASFQAVGLQSAPTDDFGKSPKGPESSVPVDKEPEPELEFTASMCKRTKRC